MILGLIRHFIARLCIVACIIPIALQARAADLAEGYHLWAVTAPNGVKSYIAASLLGDSRTFKILQKQLDQAVSVERIVVAAKMDEALLPSGEWAVPLGGANIPNELKDKLSKVFKSIAGDSFSDEKIKAVPLGAIRVFLYASPRAVGLDKPGGVKETQKLLNDFILKRPSQSLENKLVNLFILDKQEARELLKEHGNADKILQEVLDERAKNGPLGERVIQAYLSGNWSMSIEAKKALSLAIYGTYNTSIIDWSGPPQKIAIKAAPLLSEKPTLLLVAETHFLGGDDGLLNWLVRQNLSVEPITLAQ